MSAPDEAHLVRDLPWLEADWQRLSGAVAAGRLAHALLVHGPRGVGKRVLAHRLAALLACTSRGADGAGPAAVGTACGRCRSCRLFAAGTHPEVWWLAPESAGGPLTIDQVRALIERVSLTAEIAPVKAVVICPADALNRAAANALLKTLEEPPGATTLVLVSDSPARLPQTIRSRCQPVSVALPPSAVVRRWLAPQPEALAALDRVEGSPLEALRLVDSGEAAQVDEVRRMLLALAGTGADPVAAAEALRAKVDCRRLLEITQILLGQLIALKFGVHRLLSGDQAEILTPIAKRLEFSHLYAELDRVTETLRALRAGIPLNEHLVAEALAVIWSDGVAGAGTGRRG